MAFVHDPQPWLAQPSRYLYSGVAVVCSGALAVSFFVVSKVVVVHFCCRFPPPSIALLAFFVLRGRGRVFFFVRFSLEKK